MGTKISESYLPNSIEVCNIFTLEKLPSDLFRGQMDAWWEADAEGQQALTFIGKRRRSLGVDDRRR